MKNWHQYIFIVTSFVHINNKPMKQYVYNKLENSILNYWVSQKKVYICIEK